MKTRILVVDDEKTITDLVGIYLRNEGYEVQLAYNGADAAQAILTQEFDLAILDIMLPDIDGFELLRTIRTDYTYPVIMLRDRGRFPVHPTPRIPAACGSRPASSSRATRRCAPTGTT